MHLIKNHFFRHGKDGTRVKPSPQIEFRHWINFVGLTII